MILYRKYCLCILLTFAILYSCKKDEIPREKINDFIVAGYLPSWGMDILDLEVAGHLDILYYFSIAPDENGAFTADPGIYDNLSLLRAALHPDKTRIYIVVGGYYESETIFPMARDDEKRAAYIHELVSFCRENDLDGVDLDWEPYPYAIDEEEHIALVRQMSDSLKANNLEFSIAMMISRYDLSARMILMVDYINVMAYEIFDEDWNHIPMDMFEDYSARHISAGIPASRLIMGVPYFGRRPYNEGDTSPNYLKYSNIVEIASPPPEQNRYMNYSYNGIDLVRRKTRYLLNGNFAGIMAWEISMDTPYNSGYSLTRAIVEEAGR